MRLTGASRFLLALLLLLAALPLSNPAVSAQDLVATPEVSARSAYVYDATSGRELVNHNSEERRAPASTVKVVTAMVVLDHADLATEIVVLEEDVTVDGESTMNLVAGDTVTVEQLLVGLLLPSGNDAARTLARHVGTILLADAGGDPIARFVEAMNAKVAGAGLANTNFTSPDGLSDDSNQYTTAYDLAHLGAMAMEYETIETIASQASATITSVGPEARIYSLTNTNLLLETGTTELATDGVIGLKSGSTEAAGACLVLAKRQRGGNLVIAVVLGSDLAYDEAGFVSLDGRWDDMRAIIGSIDDEFAWLNPESVRDVPGLLDELAAWSVGLEDDSSIVVARDLADSIRYQLELAPVGSTQEAAGRVLFFAGSDLIAERPLVAR